MVHTELEYCYRYPRSTCRYHSTTLRSYYLFFYFLYRYVLNVHFSINLDYICAINCEKAYGWWGEQGRWNIAEILYKQCFWEILMVHPPRSFRDTVCHSYYPESEEEGCVVAKWFSIWSPSVSGCFLLFVEFSFKIFILQVRDSFRLIIIDAVSSVVKFAICLM